MLPINITLQAVAAGLNADKEASGAFASTIQDIVLKQIGPAARAEFLKVIHELESRGFELKPFGPQSLNEMHFRCPLKGDAKSKTTLVLAVDIIVTVAATS